MSTFDYYLYITKVGHMFEHAVLRIDDRSLHNMASIAVVRNKSSSALDETKASDTRSLLFRKLRLVNREQVQKVYRHTEQIIEGLPKEQVPRKANPRHLFLSLL